MSRSVGSPGGADSLGINERSEDFCQESVVGTGPRQATVVIEAVQRLDPRINAGLSEDHGSNTRRWTVDSLALRLTAI